LVELILFCTICATLTAIFAVLATLIHWAFAIPAFAALLCGAEVVYFFRDPQRAIPTDADALLSPADGTVTHVGEVEEADFPGGRAFRISIFLSIFDVHVNRVPRSGRVTNVRYFPGSFLDARNPECGVRNEQLWLDLEESGSSRPIRVKQIAGAIARRIVCWLKPEDVVQAGDRFGMIKFGSRTDILVPADAVKEALVKVGDKVKGGSTILLRIQGTADGRR
jgi:phosphatidylserine decarboxylase